MRLLLALLVCTSTLAADRAAQLRAIEGIREYYSILRGGGVHGMDWVRDRIVPNFDACPPDTQKSILNQIDKGLGRKKKEEKFYRICAEILTRCGKRGINKATKRYSKSKKNPVIRMAVADALSSCGNDAALSSLLKVVYDKDPKIAAAGVAGCGNYFKVKLDRRKAAFKKLLDRYKKVTHATRDKKKDSVEIKMYQALRPAMNETLKRFSGGEEWDSAEAWTAWLAENITKKWSKFEQ